MLVETRGLAAAPAARRDFWRASLARLTDDPMRHVLRMAAWNAMGWPERQARDPRWRPALFPPLPRSGHAPTRGAECWPGRMVLEPRPLLPGAIWVRFLPRLERVEEEVECVEKAANESCRS